MFIGLTFINMVDKNKMGESWKSSKFWMKIPLHGWKMKKWKKQKQKQNLKIQFFLQNNTW
jgi:hypothetical protein